MDLILSEFNSDFINLNHRLYRFVKSFDDVYNYLNKIKFLNWLRYLTKLLVLIVIGIVIVPAAYLLLVFFLRKSNTTIAKLQNLLSELSINELESLKEKFIQMEIKHNISQDFRIETKNTPFILKPIVFALKENVDQYFELKKSIDDQIIHDLELFSLGLESDIPITSTV